MDALNGSPLVRLTRLCEVLERIAEAASTVRPDVLLASGPSLAVSLADTAAIQGVRAPDRAEAVALVVRARRALQRGRVLGALIDRFTTASLAAQGRLGSYDRTGSRPPVADLRRTLEVHG